MSRHFVYDKALKEVVEVGAAPVDKAPIDRPMVSENCGFGEHQLVEMEAHRQAYKCSGVEFIEDRNAPGFYNVHFENSRARDNYLDKRKLYDAGRDRAAPLTGEMLQKASEFVRSRYPEQSP